MWDFSAVSAAIWKFQMFCPIVIDKGTGLEAQAGIWQIHHWLSSDVTGLLENIRQTSSLKRFNGKHMFLSHPVSIEMEIKYLSAAAKENGLFEMSALTS